MKYIIEQWDESKKSWFQVGESYSSVLALNTVSNVKNIYPDLYFRIVSILNVL